MAERQTKMIARVHEFFSETDADGDGSVTREEAQAAAFNRIDENGDGYLTREELRDAKPAYGGRHKHRHGPGRIGKRGRP